MHEAGKSHSPQPKGEHSIPGSHPGPAGGEDYLDLEPFYAEAVDYFALPSDAPDEDGLLNADFGKSVDPEQFGPLEMPLEDYGKHYKFRDHATGGLKRPIDPKTGEVRYQTPYKNPDHDPNLFADLDWMDMRFSSQDTTPPGGHTASAAEADAGPDDNHPASS